MQDWTYLDYNASTPLAPEVLSAMTDSLQAQAHPSSKHPHGLAAASLVQEARTQVALSLGTRTSEIVFCSGSTEASNHAIKGVAFAQPKERQLHFVTSSVEHPATLQPLRFLERLGHDLTVIPVDETGRIDPRDVAQALRENTVLVSLIHAQNEIGTVQPLAEVGAICESHSALFHVDASQSFGKVRVDVAQLKADLLNIAGHKIYGPKGVGALYVREGVALEPLLHGGGHESGFRSGTPAPQLIAGLGAACELARQRGPVPAAPAEALWETLEQELGQSVRRNGHPEHRVPNVVHCTFQGCHGADLLERARICASTGAACHSADGSPVLKALGFQPEQARGSVRLSTGWNTSVEQAKEAAQRLAAAFRELTASATV